MRKIDTIVIHCSATLAGEEFTVEDIRKWHTWPYKMNNGKIRYFGKYYDSVDKLPLRVQNHWGRGWLDIGYHFVVDLDGIVRAGRSIEKIGAHVQGHNRCSIGMVYIGGLNEAGDASDTRTQGQKQSLHIKCEELVERYPTIRYIKGHRDFSEDINHNGVIESWEWIKACPCFDVQSEFGYIIK